MEVLKFLAFIYTSAAALNCTGPAGHFLPLSCVPLHILSFHILSPLKHPLALLPSPHSTLLGLFELNQHFRAVCRLAQRLSMELIMPHPVSTAQMSLNVPNYCHFLMYFLFIPFNGATFPKKYTFPFPSCHFIAENHDPVRRSADLLLIILKTKK